jgi:hypothetical protein
MGSFSAQNRVNKVIFEKGGGLFKVSIVQGENGSLTHVSHFGLNRSQTLHNS